MTRFWIIVSALCGVAAIGFVLWDDYDKAFIAATLGAVAWFLNYRSQLAAKNKTDDEEDQL